MVKLLRKTMLIGLIGVFFICLIPDVTEADTTKIQTKVAQYALSWDGEKKIPYVYGGGRHGETLESLTETTKIEGHPNGSSCIGDNRCEKCKYTGTDCSGFTSMVYAKFGIKIPAQSEWQKNAAVELITDVNKAVPGDICWWSGHVAIYLGDNKIVHTNTTYPPYNFPHVNIIDDIDYPKPTYFLRMVDDVSKLGILSSSEAQDYLSKVGSAEAMGSMITESDLTGLDITSELTKGMQSIPEITPITGQQLNTLELIKNNIINGRSESYNIVGAIISFLGILCIVYGVLLLVGYLFDRTNNLFSISLLSILTLGKYKMLEVDSGVSRGYNKHDGCVYCDSSFLMKRVLLLEAVGFLLVSGFIFKIVMWIVSVILSKIG